MTAHNNVIRPPQHHGHCFGCGPLNPFGLQMELNRDGDNSIVGSFVLRPGLQGPPAIGHGGVIAAALDETMSMLVHTCGITARTTTLQVEYLAPAFVDGRITVRANLERSEGRRLWLTARMYREVDHKMLATASGTFATIGGDGP